MGALGGTGVPVELILFGEASLRRARNEFIEHYHAERITKGKGNVLLFPTQRQTCSPSTVALLDRKITTDRSGSRFSLPRGTGASGAGNKRKTVIKRRLAILIQSACGWRILVKQQGRFSTTYV